MVKPSFKTRLAGGMVPCGLWSMTSSPIVAEIMAGAGADWLLFDMEHSASDLASVLAQLQASQGGEAALLVRPPSDDAVTLKRLLDAGAHNLLVPFVNDAGQARAIVRATRYPPAGIRGVAGSNRGAGYGRDRAYLQDANDRVCTLVQIESAQAVRNAGEIAALEGIDGIFIGPSDLAADLGHLGDTSHPEVRAAMTEVLETVTRLGKPVGTFASSPADARERLSQGFAFVAVITDVRLLVQGAQRALAEARGTTSPMAEGAVSGY